MAESPELPLTEAVFLILLSLTPDPQHGYGIMKDVERLSGGRVTFSTGTLYGALKRLLEQGWIERYDSAEKLETGRERKDYRLTPHGERVLHAETARLETLARVSRMRLQGDVS